VGGGRRSPRTARHCGEPCSPIKFVTEENLRDQEVNLSTRQCAAGSFVKLFNSFFPSNYAKTNMVSAISSPGFLARGIIGDSQRKLGNFIAVDRCFLATLSTLQSRQSALLSILPPSSSTPVFYATITSPPWPRRCPKGTLSSPEATLVSTASRSRLRRSC
jgi:hypothetical protein